MLIVILYYNNTILSALNMNKLLLLLGFICYINFSFSQSANAEAASHIHVQSTKGTFQFESPSGKTLFWRMDFIEDLYPEIESRREQSEPVYWHYNNDMTIVIFSREYISDPYFTPLESPYNGVKIPE